MSHSKIPAREWKQVRISPEESSAVQRLATAYGLSFPSALRQVIRAGAGLPSIVPTKALPNKQRVKQV
jgi:hypothetical protein